MNDTPPQRRIPWLKLALALSVFLNFLALGMVWGVASRTGPSGSLLRASVAALPAEERRALRRESGAIWREARSDRWREASAPRALIAALEADEFDAEAFSGALREAQERLLRISDQMHDRLLSKVSAMSVDERRAYAITLQEQFGKRRWRPRPDPAQH